MKIKALVAILCFSASLNVMAQDDSNCAANSSISHEAVRAGNFKDAYLPWKKVLEECPTLRFYTFTDGYKLLKGLLSQIKDKKSPEYQKYFNDLMETHDLRIKYTPEFKEKGLNVSSVEKALGIKALDYITYSPKIDVDLVYGWLSESVNATKVKTPGPVLFYYLQMSLNKLKANKEHKEQFIQDYMMTSEYANEALKGMTKERYIKMMNNVKSNLVALFINSGVADCESLENIYAPKIEENKDDLEYLKKVINIMKIMKCTESDTYLQASYYAYEIEPTPDAATGCAYMAFKKGDIDAAIEFFDEGIEMESDNVEKAKKAYAAAVMLFNSKKLSQSRAYARKAISFDGNYGDPYILIASLYATSPNWTEEPALNKCTYFAVIDKLIRAKSVDPSVAEEANKLINRYSQYTPEAKDLFMLGYKTGDTVKLGGWIGETVTIR